MSFTLGLILTCTVFTNNSYAEGGNQIWLKKTKRGIDISCPSGFQYDEKIRYMCTKQNDAGFDITLSYNDLYVEEEFFAEKEIMKQAIILVKLSSNVKIIEKKASTWFGKITADIKYESDGLKGLQRMIVFNDGTVIVMNYLSGNKSYDMADKVLSENVKILEPSQVKELEKIQAEYTKQAQELASKNQAENYKKKIEQDKKKAEQDKKKAEQDKKKKKEIQENTKPITEKVQYWKNKVAKLDVDFQRISTKIQDCPRSEGRWNQISNGIISLNKSILKFENNIKNIDHVQTQKELNDFIKKYSESIANEYELVDIKFGDYQKYENSWECYWN